MEDRVVDGAAARLVELKLRIEDHLVRQLLVGHAPGQSGVRPTATPAIVAASMGVEAFRAERDAAKDDAARVRIEFKDRVGVPELDAERTAFAAGRKRARATSSFLMCPGGVGQGTWT
jgi:hypothetical protein